MKGSFIFQSGSPEETNGNEKTLSRLLKLDHPEWFVDDRSEFTIGYRLKDCQKLGIPIVIAFGKRAVISLQSNPLSFSVHQFRLNKIYVKSSISTIIELNIYLMMKH